MAFADEATLFVRGGRGGDGAVSFRREPYTPRGGPNGADGGRGGDVLLEVSTSVRDLSWLDDHPHQRATNGGPGAGGGGGAARGGRRAGRGAGGQRGPRAGPPVPAARHAVPRVGDRGGLVRRRSGRGRRHGPGRARGVRPGDGGAPGDRRRH